MDKKIINIILISDDPSQQRLVEQSLSQNEDVVEYKLKMVGDLAAAIKALGSERFANVLLNAESAEDITKSAQDELKATKAELEDINGQLLASVQRANQLAEEAMSANRTKSEFLANVSHEIRTPMNAIIGFSEMLAEENLSQEQLRYTQTIAESAEGLLDLLNDVLDFSKIEAGKFDVDIVPCCLDELLEGIVNTMASEAKRKGLEFELHCSSNLPQQIRTDPMRLRQCLINLVGNAIKFTEKGHVYLNVSLQGAGDESRIRFDVQDSGIGISEADHQIIFDAFIQVRNTAMGQSAGTGLGLAITRKMTRLLGGEIELTSRPGKGSVFSLLIPARLDVAADGLGLPEADSARQQQSEHLQRVLVAEDNPSNQLLMEQLLRKAGLDVVIVNDGQKAVEKASSESFGLVLMDIKMPNMDGFEATKQLRDMGRTMPIIALTAGIDDKVANRCVESGCTAYLSKPIRRKDLYEMIGKYVCIDEATALCSSVGGD